MGMVMGIATWEWEKMGIKNPLLHSSVVLRYGEKNLGFDFETHNLKLYFVD